MRWVYSTVAIKNVVKVRHLRVSYGHLPLKSIIGELIVTRTLYIGWKMCTFVYASFTTTVLNFSCIKGTDEKRTEKY